MTARIEVPATFPQSGDVTGKRVVITGSGRGLGRVLATSFSFAGAKVALVARTEDDLRSAAADLPGETLICAGDVTDEEFNESAANAVVEAWGGLDVWISNAGISPIVEGPRETTAQIWREIVDVNLTGTFLGARSASRVMTSGGRIIFTGSVLGDRPRRGLSAYSATKAAVVALAKGLALDLAGQGITVNVVAPGWFDSPLVVPWMRDEERSAELLDHITFGRLGRPAELPGAYLYLASDAASYVTGTVLNLDGGYSLQ